MREKEHELGEWTQERQKSSSREQISGRCETEDRQVLDLHKPG